MKVLRVAETKKMSENAYEEVDNLDLATDSRAKVSENIVIRININSKNAEVRHTLMTIIFTDEDILALYQGLIVRWRKELADYKKLQIKNKKLNDDVNNLYRARSDASYVLKYAKKEGFRKFEIDKLESIISEIDKIRGILPK